MTMLKRKAYQKLLSWKEEQNGKSALLINGARRVGKSYLAEEFGKREYRSYIIINFAEQNEYNELFSKETSDLDLFFNKLSVTANVKLYRRESLIILDEVQMFPLARQRLKKLVADGRYDYIETGSLLSIKTNVKGIVIPSEEFSINLYPLDFEEFLWSLDDDISIPFITDCFEKKMPVGDAIHQKMTNHLREYMLVGGMPQAVLEYIDTKDFARVDGVKRRILNLYRNDIGKFATGYEKKVTAAFDQIPSQLSKKEKRFKLSSLGVNARMRTYESAFMWLEDGMITNQCYNATDPSFGLNMSLDESTMKCYMGDTGLLVTHALFDSGYANNNLYREILLDRLNVNEGMLMENYVAQMLRANDHRLFFYSRPRNEERRYSIEIDFLIKMGGRIHPVEVKSSGSTHHASLDRFREKFAKRIGMPIVICPKDLKMENGVLFIPLYMAILLKQDVNLE